MAALRPAPLAAFSSRAAVAPRAARPAVRLQASSSRSSMDRIDDLLSNEDVKKAVSAQINKKEGTAAPADGAPAAAPAKAPASPTAPAQVLPDGTVVFTAEQLKKVSYGSVKL